jgi:hypothetical protein
MLCQLCQQEKKLMKAHIMPDSMNHELRKVLGDDPNSPMLSIEKGSGKTKRLPMGNYDKTIICSGCDGSFSPWETHALDVLFRKHAWTDVQTDGHGNPRCYTLLNADYASLKLFVHSMLWKAAVSQLGFCAKVVLPAATIEKLRQLLVSGDPGDATTFAVRIAQFYEMDAPITFEPMALSIDGIAYVALHVPGYKILVQVDNQPLPPDHDLVLAPASEIRVRLLDFQGSAERRAVEKMAAKL